MATVTPVEPTPAEAFLSTFLKDFTGGDLMWMCCIGDRLGLFNDLDTHGPATSAELAARARIQERYAREWLSALACGGYLTYDPLSRRFSLPPAHAPTLAQEGGPLFMGGMVQIFAAYGKILDRLIEAFRSGGGVPFDAYDDNMWEGTERATAPWFQNLLVAQWLPVVPDVQHELEQGIRVADVGCGSGRALIELARTFPRSHFTGYDAVATNIERARRNAKTAGVADRVTFQHQVVTDALPELYDLITTFDVVHDAADPLGLITAIGRSLRPGGTYLCLEVNCAETLEENLAAPFGAWSYSSSVLYCLTTSLAQGGVGLGSSGLPEGTLRELCRAAGFTRVRRLPIENPFNTLYEITP